LLEHWAFVQCPNKRSSNKLVIRGGFASPLGPGKWPREEQRWALGSSQSEAQGNSFKIWAHGLRLSGMFWQTPEVGHMPESERLLRMD